MSRWSRRPKNSEIAPPGRATVHRDAHARNERGARRYQEAHEIGDVLGARDAFQRIRAHRLGAMGLDGLPGRRGLLGDEALPARGRRRGGRYGRDENVRGRTEVGETLREVYEPPVCDPARQVAGDDENLRFRLRLDLLRGLLEPRLVASADRDPGALGAQAERDGPPDPLASARHQRRLAGQFEIHEVSFLTLSAAGSRSGEGRDRSPAEAEKLVQ